MTHQQDFMGSAKKPSSAAEKKTAPAVPVADASFKLVQPLHPTTMKMQ